MRPLLIGLLLLAAFTPLAATSKQGVSKVPLVALDAGHGSSGIQQDTGAVAGGVYEGDLTLSYALALAEELQMRGVPTLLTRTTERSVSLPERAARANRAGASFFLSLHFNASRRPEASGVWALHMDGSARSEALAHLLANALGGRAYPDDSPYTGGRRLYVLRRTRMPAVLLELGFLTNEEERRRLTDDAHKKVLINRIADAVAEVTP